MASSRNDSTERLRTVVMTNSLRNPEANVSYSNIVDNLDAALHPIVAEVVLDEMNIIDRFNLVRNGRAITIFWLNKNGNCHHHQTIAYIAPSDNAICRIESILRQIDEEDVFESEILFVTKNGVLENETFPKSRMILQPDGTFSKIKPNQ